MLQVGVLDEPFQFVRSPAISVFSSRISVREPSVAPIDTPFLLICEVMFITLRVIFLY